MSLIAKTKSRLRTKVRTPKNAQNPEESVTASETAGTNNQAVESLFASASRREAEEQAPSPVDEEPNPPQQTPTKNPNWFQRRRETRKLQGKFSSYPHLLALKPKERYLFRSDYFQVDGSVACVLAFFHDDAAAEGFQPFWGIHRIPDGLDDNVTAIVLEQVERMTDKWIESNLKRSERLEGLSIEEEEETGTASTRKRAEKISVDLDTTITELHNGASYLSVHNRLLLKAPDLPTLEKNIRHVSDLYIDRFATLRVAPYAGEQRQELAGLCKDNEKKRGKGFYYTSTEFAGSHSLVTNGLNDPTGEYVGFLVGDVNDSAILFDPNIYDHHVVIADAKRNDFLNREYVSNMWCSKISQSCLSRNGQVVHLILDDTNLDNLGPKFDGLTARVDMNSGDINPFEMFGNTDDELSIFAAHMKKLRLMFGQLYRAEVSKASIISNELEAVATNFYVDERMWSHNAKENRDRLRVVNIPHKQVPRLQKFASYIDMAHKALVNSKEKDPNILEAYNQLRSVANSMLSTNGDLFNNHTSEAVDDIREAQRVVYDFSKIRRRGQGQAMAQLVNIVGFAVEKLGRNDTVIVHGTENIAEEVKEYISEQFDHLFHRGGRVVYSYNSMNKMLADKDFNTFDAADYTVFGPMRDATVDAYEKTLHQVIPPDLRQLISRRDQNFTYLRRGVTNVVFHLELALGINPAREKERRRLHLQARKQEETERFEAITEQEPIPGARRTGHGGPVHPGPKTLGRNKQPRAKKTAKKSASKMQKKSQARSTR